MQSLDPELKKAMLSKNAKPAVVYWNRLEGRPRKVEIDRTLKVEIRDPLWMLCRQWQVGEFHAEDAGSAVAAKVQINTTRLNRFAARGGQAVPYDESVPLEATVESEHIFSPADEGAVTQLQLRVEMGQHWLKLLLQFTEINYRVQYLQKYGFIDPGEIADPTPEEKLGLAHLRSDRKAWQVFAAVKDRVIDGAKLMMAIHSGDHLVWLENDSGINDATEKERILKAATAFIEWFRRIYHQPGDETGTSWAPAYLEYQFTCSAPNDESGRSKTVLTAEQYHQGHLDSYAFDIDPTGEAMPDEDSTTQDENIFEVRAPLSFIPTQIEFTGMPNVRWWTFEDRQTEFGHLRTDTTDLATLMLAEFGLIYGNDWTVVPYDLEIGTLAEIKGIVVTDVFGVRTFVRPAGSGPDDDWQHWNVYNQSTIGPPGPADTRLFLAPAIGKLQEGKPFEKVILARDEMANMVWGVEQTIPGVLGSGVDGYETATALENFFRQNEGEQPTTPEETDAKIQYKLGTTVPENWIPFIAVRTPETDRMVQLQRAAMPRLSDAIPESIVEPRSKLLRHGLDSPEPEPYHVHQEEVLRAGVVISRGFQRTRWFDGRIYTWVGRSKQTGHGEGASGLAFDQIIPVDQ
ncbi:MAG: hypothetical protein O7G31_14390 [Calditrichaeota bacterium]|nr:hypothetical protein [Calditrichota bacterium]